MLAVTTLSLPKLMKVMPMAPSASGSRLATNSASARPSVPSLVQRLRSTKRRVGV